MSLKAAPLPIVLVVLSFLAPTELSLYIADLRLPPHRVVLLLALPFALQRLASGNAKLRSYDALFLIFAIWTVIVFTSHEGQPGFIYGGSLALESFGSYAIARAFIRTRTQFDACLRLLILMVAITLVLALPEFLFGQHFVHDLLQAVTGYVAPRNIEFRKGFARAYATFDHPIHLGVFCVSILSLALYSVRSLSARLRRASLIILATATAISSGPILCLLMQLALMSWERVSRMLRHRVLLLVAVIAGLYIGASFVMTRSPIAVLAVGFTLDPWTGFYRLQIWEHGLQNVSDHWFMGLGRADWSRPEWMVASTIDAYWLVVAMSQGAPAFLILATAILLLARAVGRRVKRSPDRKESQIGRAWLIALLALSLMACTVHFWNALHAYFFFFLGIAGWMADPPRRARYRPKATQSLAAEPFPRVLQDMAATALARPAR